MKSSDLIRLALQHQTEMTTIANLERRIKTLEAQIEAMTVPKKEEPLPEMTEKELEEWVKTAADSITHITNIDVCSKCSRTVTTEVPVGQWKHMVKCGKCGHAEEKDF